MALYFRVRDRREVPASEALDARGILRHGYGQRVPFRDGAPRFTDARAFWDANRDALVVTDARAIGGVAGCKPGFRVADSPINRQEIVDAYADYDRDRQSAWRSPSRDEFGRIPYAGARAGDQCTVDGHPGRLVKEGNSLVCRPLAADAAPPRDPEEDDDEDEDDEDDNGKETATADRRTVSVDAMSAAHQKNMQRLYDAHARELSEAWRKP